MTQTTQTLFGLLLVIAGGAKIWLHASSFPMLPMTMCNGTATTVNLTGASLFTQVHCWGCYAVAAGLLVLALTVYQSLRHRRNLAKVAH